jgi:hypothetical protein
MTFDLESYDHCIVSVMEQPGELPLASSALSPSPPPRSAVSTKPHPTDPSAALPTPVPGLHTLPVLLEEDLLDYASSSDSSSTGLSAGKGQQAYSPGLAGRKLSYREALLSSPHHDDNLAAATAPQDRPKLPSIRPVLWQGWATAQGLRFFGATRSAPSSMNDV